MSERAEQYRPQDATAEIKQRLLSQLDKEVVRDLGLVVDLAVKAHEGREGLGGKPLVLHSTDVALASDLETLEQRQLGLLHDAATPGYSNFTQEEFIERAKQAGCSARVIAAALCFARPTLGWDYDDWISFLMRDDLTRLVKKADSDAAIANFPPASENQLAAWKRTRDRLAENAPEPPEVTARIARSMETYPLPDIRALSDSAEAA